MSECDCCGYDGIDLPRYRSMMQDVLDNLVRKRTAALEDGIRDLVKIKSMADSGTASFANQGQAMDGYSELANYRYLIDKMAKTLDENG